MMVKPPLKALEKRVDSKYTLVTLAAKRARELKNVLLQIFIIQINLYL